IAALGEKAMATRPEIEQIMFSMPQELSEQEAERQLYLIRRRIEKAVLAELVTDFYICSLSTRSIIYKGMFLAEQVTAFYPDLLDELFVSNFAVYHQRYSTNTFPTWRLAQPFRVLAHNGEINTVRGNMNWMSCHEDRMDTAVFEGAIEDIKPVIAKGSSDSAALDSVFELLLQGGRDLPMVKTMMIPQAVDVSADTELAKLYAYCNSVMEPWDGPAAIAAVSGDWVIGGMDRNGLRPMRFMLTDDGLMIAGSETGMVHIDEAHILERGRLGPGEMIGVNLAEGRIVYDAELKSELVGRQDWAKWTSRAKPMDSLLAVAKQTAEDRPDEDTRRRRQLMSGWSMEDMELILAPMAA
ncbi:MAG: class II glutamine amidotransferase, partial [Candidatus Puniceispirillaceae bacterium]